MEKTINKSTTMKILFTFTVPLEQNSGGVQRVTSILMQEFNKMGVFTSYLQCNDTYTRFIYNQKEYLTLSSIIKDFDIIINQDGYSDTFTKRLIKENWKGKYIVCLHNTPNMYEKYYSFKSMIQGLRYSTWSRKWYLIRTILYPIWKPVMIKGFIKKQKFNYLYANATILLSNKFINLFVNNTRIKSPEKLYAINNPLTYDYDPIYHKENKKNEILIVSRLSSEKRIELAIKAWELVTNKENWILTIVGDGSSKDSLIKFVKSNNIPNVYFKGLQNPLDYYKRSKIFLMTSAFEGWGMTLTEAQQNGCVPIAMNSYLSITDIISDSHNGIIIENNNIKKFAKAIEELINNQDKLDRMAINAIKSTQKFQSQHIAQTWIKLISNIR